MKKVFILCLSMCLGHNIFAQNDMTIFENKEKFGLKNSENKTVVKAAYDKMHLLRTNYYFVMKDEKAGVIYKDGKTVVPPIYDDIQVFADDYFLVTDNGLQGIMDAFDRTILPVEYTGFRKLNNFLYEIDNNGKKGFLTSFGQIIIPPKYDEITKLTERLFLIKNEGKVGIADAVGAIIVPVIYDKMEKLPNDDLYEIRIEDRLGIIDLSGKVIADPIFDELDTSDKRYIILRKDGKYGFVINKQCIPAAYDKIVFTQDDLGVIAVKQGDLNGFVTIYGLVVPPVYDNISRFSPAGYAFVEKQGKLMFVDITGKERTLQEVTGRGNRPPN